MRRNVTYAAAGTKPSGKAKRAQHEATAARGTGFSRVPQNPTIPAVTAAMPITVSAKVRAISPQRAVQQQRGRGDEDEGHDEGRPADAHRRETRWPAGRSLVIVAAAKAASATGGVIIDIMPK